MILGFDGIAFGNIVIFTILIIPIYVYENIFFFIVENFHHLS